MQQESRGEGKRERRYASLVGVLAYFAANRNFGYVDVLANSLDPLTAKETMINAVRDFMSACDPERPAREGRDEVPCPRDVKVEYLERDLNLFIGEIESGWDRFFRVTRNLALQALARAASLRFPRQGESKGEGQS